MITNTTTITIAIITIAIINIAIITISPGRNTHTYTNNWWEVGSSLCWIMWVGVLLYPRFNFLPVLQNLIQQLSTPWLWGIMRSRRGGYPKIRVTLWYRLMSWFRPPATHLLVPGPSNSTSPWIEHPGVEKGAYSQEWLGVSCLLRVYLGACSGVWLRESWELIWKCTVKQARSVPSSAIGGVLESESALECKWSWQWVCNRVQ